MTGSTDARVEAACVARIAEGPADVVALCAVARAAAGPRFDRCEGEIHALIHREVKAGRIVPAGRSPSGATRYGAGGAPPSSSEPGIDAPPAASMTASKKALAVASGVEDAEDRGRLAADVLAHLAAIQASTSPRSFGSASHARGLLHRVDRGRATLCVATTMGDAAKRFLVHEGPGLLAAAVVFGCIWLFLVEPRVVPSRSMEPTLMPGDRVVVWKPVGGQEPPRWSVIVFRRHDDVVLVKRVVGLPGEEIQIRDGDAYVNGELLVKPDDVREAVRAPLVRSTFSGGRVPDGWALAPGDARSTYAYGRRLFADVPRAEDEPFFTQGEGRPEVHDLYVDARLAPDGALEPAAITIRWPAPPPGAAKRSFAVGLRLDASGRRRLLAWDDATARVLGASDGPTIPDGEAVDLSLSYVDGVVRARIGAWSATTPLEVSAGGASVEVGGKPRSVAIDRDVHYTKQGHYATEQPYPIPPGHVFCLGDHSYNSTDSRYPTPIGPGPVPISRILGRVVFRIWPPWRVGLVH